MNVDPTTARGWRCSACWEDVRITSSSEPARPCMKCGQRLWLEMIGEDIDTLLRLCGRKTRSIDLARVFYCRRCKAGPRVQWDGGDVGREPCGCGSRYFSELVGPEKVKLLEGLDG